MSRYTPKPKIERADRNGVVSPPRRGWHREVDVFFGRHTALNVRNGYHAERCTGGAHQNAFIDYCSSCMNHTFGWRAVKDDA